jgi:hypothetical protein
LKYENWMRGGAVVLTLIHLDQLIETLIKDVF